MERYVGDPALAAPPPSDTAEIYDRIASGYMRWWAPVIAPAALRLLDLVDEVVVARPRAVLVDVGAGTGTLTRGAVARWPGVRAIAVDASEGMLDVGRAEARRTLPAAGLRRLRWMRGVAEQLPVPDRCADVVVSSFTLQYLPSRIAALREASRVLRPGGAIAVVTWMAGDRPFEPWSMLTALIRELDLERPADEGVHRSFRSLPSAAALVRRAGFGRVHASEGVVEYQWSPDDFLAYAVQCEERPLFQSLDPPTRTRLVGLWRTRLADLGPADLLIRDAVCYVTGRRPSS